MCLSIMTTFRLEQESGYGLITISNIQRIHSNNNNNQDDIYGAVIMAKSLREFTRFI